jgi:hypothetical protein
MMLFKENNSQLIFKEEKHNRVTDWFFNKIAGLESVVKDPLDRDLWNFKPDWYYYLACVIVTMLGTVALLLVQVIAGVL